MVDVPSHERLNCGCGDAPQRDKGNCGKNDPATGRETETEEADCAVEEACGEAEALAEFLDIRANKRTGDEGGAHADDREGKAYVAIVPSVAIFGINRPNGHERLMGEVIERDDDG